MERSFVCYVTSLQPSLLICKLVMVLPWQTVTWLKDDTFSFLVKARQMLLNSVRWALPLSLGADK